MLDIDTMNRKPNSVSIQSKTKRDNKLGKKEIVRNAQVPVRKSAVKTVSLNLDVDNAEGPATSTKSVSDSACPDNQKQGEAGSSRTKISRKSNEKATSSDKEKEEVKRVNIPFSEKKFRCLVDLGSLETALVEAAAETGSKRRGCLPSRDPEPVLSDYYHPKFDTEYVFTFPPTPVSASKEWAFNPRAVVNILDQIKETDESKS